MKEIIGENLQLFFDNMGIDATKSYVGNIGYWPHFEVWELSEEDYIKICGMSDEEYEQIASDDSWWRGAEGSNMGAPSYEFMINNQSILGWSGRHSGETLQEEWDSMTEDERSEYEDFDDYCAAWSVIHYNDILEYFCEEIGASTERNVCALATDLAKYNNITIAELFRKYGGSKNEDN